MSTDPLRPQMEFDDDRRVVRICGVPYSYEFFHALGCRGLDIGAVVEVVNRDDQEIVLRSIDLNEELEAARAEGAREFRDRVVDLFHGAVHHGRGWPKGFPEPTKAAVETARYPLRPPWPERWEDSLPDKDSNFVGAEAVLLEYGHLPDDEKYR